jgi:PAS domain-containing protein
MTRPEIDYGAVFRDFPGAVALLTPEFVIADANSMYLQVAGRTLDDLLGRNIVDAFPDNPADPDATGTRNLTESLQRVLDTEAQDCMPLQRYDVEVPGSPGVFEERYWSLINTPVFGSDGRVSLIVLRGEEVTVIAQQLIGLQASSA